MAGKMMKKHLFVREEKTLRKNVLSNQRSFDCGKAKFRPNSPERQEREESGKVSQVVNEVMTTVTAVEGDLNHLREWRAETYTPDPFGPWHTNAN